MHSDTEPKKFSWRARFRSFRYAFEGIRWFCKHEHNAWLHAVAVLVVLVLSFLLKISRPDFVSILLCVGLVLVAEMLNTAIEKGMDHLSPEKHPVVKIVKDVSAGAVLVAAIVSVIVGLMVFIPKILSLFNLN